MVDRSFNHLNLFVCLLFIEKGESKKTLESGWDMYDSIEKRKQCDAYLFHHEFLYIVCNTQNRIQ